MSIIVGSPSAVLASRDFAGARRHPPQTTRGGAGRSRFTRRDRTGAGDVRQDLGIACRDEPRAAVARSGQERRGTRIACACLRLVYGGVRDRRPQRSKGAARQLSVTRPPRRARELAALHPADASWTFMDAGCITALPHASLERQLTALCSRWLTARRTAEDAPHLPFAIPAGIRSTGCVADLRRTTSRVAGCAEIGPCVSCREASASYSERPFGRAKIPIRQI